MKRKSAEIKRIARENLTGHYGLPMGAMVVSQLIVTLPTMFFSWNLTPYSGNMEWAIYYVAAFVLALLGVVLNIGILRIALRMGRKACHISLPICSMDSIIIRINTFWHTFYLWLWY